MSRPIRPMLIALALLGSTLGDASYVHKEPTRLGHRRLPKGQDANKVRVGKDARQASGKRAPDPIESKKSKETVKGSMVNNKLRRSILSEEASDSSDPFVTSSGRPRKAKKMSMIRSTSNQNSYKGSEPATPPIRQTKNSREGASSVDLLDVVAAPPEPTRVKYTGKSYKAKGFKSSTEKSDERRSYSSGDNLVLVPSSKSSTGKSDDDKRNYSSDENLVLPPSSSPGVKTKHASGKGGKMSEPMPSPTGASPNPTGGESGREGGGTILNDGPTPAAIITPDLPGGHLEGEIKATTFVIIGEGNEGSPVVTLQPEPTDNEEEGMTFDIIAEDDPFGLIYCRVAPELRIDRTVFLNQPSNDISHVPDCIGGYSSEDFDTHARGSWFKVTGNGARLSANSCPALVSIFRGTCGDLKCAHAKYNSFGCKAEWTSIPGETYFVLVQSSIHLEEESKDESFTLDLELTIETVEGSSYDATDDVILDIDRPKESASLDEEVIIEECKDDAMVVEVDSQITSDFQFRFSNRDVTPCGRAIEQPRETAVEGAWITVRGKGEFLRASSCPFTMSVFDGDCDNLICAAGKPLDLLTCDFEWKTTSTVNYILVQSTVAGVVSSGPFDFSVMRVTESSVVPTIGPDPPTLPPATPPFAPESDAPTFKPSLPPGTSSPTVSPKTTSPVTPATPPFALESDAPTFKPSLPPDTSSPTVSPETTSPVTSAPSLTKVTESPTFVPVTDNPATVAPSQPPVESTDPPVTDSPTFAQSIPGPAPISLEPTEAPVDIPIAAAPSSLPRPEATQTPTMVPSAKVTIAPTNDDEDDFLVEECVNNSIDIEADERFISAFFFPLSEEFVPCEVEVSPTKRNTIRATWFQTVGGGRVYKADACPYQLSVYGGSCEELACSDGVYGDARMCDFEWTTASDGAPNYILVQSTISGFPDSGDLSFTLSISDEGDPVPPLPTSIPGTLAPTPDQSQTTVKPSVSPAVEPTAGPDNPLPGPTNPALTSPFPTESPVVPPSTSAPTATPVMGIPTAMPFTVSPTFQPATGSPTAMPTTIAPTGMATGMPTTAPSQAPVTKMPTMIPTTLSPTFVPTTVSPTGAPTFVSPTKAPVPIPYWTLPPTRQPTTMAPTDTPSTSPPTISTLPPTTVAPTESPVTSAPTAAPTTIAPTDPPVTIAPTLPPTTVAPTESPVTSPPTAAPTTMAPTDQPVTIAPTLPPTTVAPTESPVTIAPTLPPTTIAPTLPLVTIVPTESPVASPPTIAAVPPRNDNCPGSLPLNTGETILTSTEGATEEPRGLDTCFRRDVTNVTVTRPGIWYDISVMPSSTETTRVRLSACNGTAADAAPVHLTLYESDNNACEVLICAETINHVGCALEFDIPRSSSREGLPLDIMPPADIPADQRQRQVQLTYKLLVEQTIPSNSMDDGGAFWLSLEPSRVPPNDVCLRSQYVDIGDTISSTALSATPEPPQTIALCDRDNGDMLERLFAKDPVPGVWYRMFVGGRVGLVASACNSERSDLVHVTVYTGACNALECLSDPIDSPVSCETMWDATSSESVYFILVERVLESGLDDGDFELNVGIYRK